MVSLELLKLSTKSFLKILSSKVKAEETNLNHIGSPLPGQVAKVFVSEGAKIIKRRQGFGY